MKNAFGAVAALVLFIIVSAVQNEDQTLGCVYSWNLDQNKSTCSVHCPTSFHMKFNAYCNFLALKSLSLKYNSSSQILSIPSGTSMRSLNGGSTVPTCYKVTLREGQYQITSDRFIRISPYLMEISTHLSVYANDNVSICYPTSPQLLQCDIERTPFGAYEIVNETQLIFITKKNYTVLLGDFFIDDNKMAVTCEDSLTNQLSFKVIPRCNLINVNHNDIRVNADGSVTLLRANFTIKNPIYSVNYTEFLLVCVPLSMEFLNCPTKRKVSEGLYVLLTNLSVFNVYYDETTLSSDSYYITMDGELVSCVSNPNKGLTLFVRVFLSFFYISGAFLLLTLIIRFHMFVQTFQGLYLMSHVASLMVASCIIGLRLFSATFNPIPCYLTFALDYFFVMATILWLNVMAYDSWSYFSNLLPRRRKGKAVKKYIVYNVIVWGIASFLTAIVLLIELSAPPFDFNTPFQLNIIVPQFPFNHTMWNVCFFNNWRIFNLFFSLPVFVFSLVNIAFMLLTIRCIHRAGRGTELVNHRRHRQLFKISVRLFVVMGFCWTVDSLCYLVGSYATSPYHMWYIVVGMGVVSVQGFLIFVIYCASRQVLRSFFLSFCVGQKTN